ncbi:MAG TPA: hypothetical protein VLT61_10435, partial [Anaeromyxobacteraceae bacterium]|nr:hypothetical protein [Anaeromyxobacteraceae bacterium]
ELGSLSSPPPGERTQVRGQAARPAEVARDAAPAAGSLAPTLSLGEGERGSSASVDSRRDRLEKIKRRVADAARPRPVTATPPADPARAAESVIGLVRELETDLAGARAREDALRADLESSRAEAARAGAEARQAVGRLAESERQLEEKRCVLSDLLAEMGALESERDEALRRSQALAALDEERARLLEDLTRRADEEARLRAEREGEVERLSEELRTGAADGARLRSALAQVARERDDAAGELERTRRERDELLDAKRALEQVHTALAQARARLG